MAWPRNVGAICLIDQPIRWGQNEPKYLIRLDEPIEYQGEMVGILAVPERYITWRGDND